MTASEYKAQQAEILLKVFRPHPYLQPEDKLFLADPKLVEAAQALDDLFLEVVGEDEPDLVIEELDNKSQVVQINPSNQLRASIRAIVKGGES